MAPRGRKQFLDVRRAVPINHQMHRRLVDAYFVDRDARRVKGECDVPQPNLFPRGHGSPLVAVSDRQGLHAKIPLKGHERSLRMLGGVADRSVEIDSAAVHGDTGELPDVGLERLDRDVFQDKRDICSQRLHEDLPLGCHDPAVIEAVFNRHWNRPFEGKDHIVRFDREVADFDLGREIERLVFKLDIVIRDARLFE